MSKSKNNLTSLGNFLSQGRSGRKTGSLPPSGSSAGSPEVMTTTTKLSLGSNSSLRSQSLNQKADQSIEFGKPSSNRTSTTTAPSDLSSLLKMTESSGLSSLLGGGGLLGGLTGLGSLGSLISGLFGGSSAKALPPLPLFTLPQATSETYSVKSQVGTSSGAGRSQAGSGIYAAPESVTPAAASIYTVPAGFYNAPSNMKPAATTTPASSPNRVVQAVKIALLNSSSLNDVINEL